MTMWYPDPESLTSPLHASLAQALAKAISDGRWAKGAQLPTHRRMAEQLGLSVHTVSKAYDSLRRQRLIDGQVGRGSFVTGPEAAGSLPYRLQSETGGGFDLSISRPLFAQLHADRFQQALQQLPEGLDPSCYLSTRPNAGHEAHRQAGAEWLRICGLEVPAGRILMTNGVSHGLSAALTALARPGDTVVADKITHHLLVSACASLGLTLAGLEMDGDGMLPDALQEFCRDNNPKALFLLPSLANATAGMMPEARRRALVEVARRHDLLIIENDAFGPVAEDRPVPVAALAPERTVYLTTFTKCTLPGLRAGYLAAPEHLLPALTGRIVVFSWMATPLMCELASRWVRDGTALELARWQRRVLAERHAIAAEVLQGWNWQGHPAALHLWLALPGGWTSEGFAAYARQLNVAVAPDTPFLAPRVLPQNAVRISLGSVQDPVRFRQGLELLAGMLRQPPEAAAALAF
ncbi:MocR-like ectoine utilization transcription factor EhuR [Leisingera sp. McT4-56]|uniref:MocR-like ectoine utilization transcription factor EhuR n=1 Tax=Leisingera sp. McT4-56 TaxID=2881255 RepID=UPI001CF906C4|nr:PLP-dependent aminotransferase family protein [Leisingera sp. McT4-56]MCB4456782.1 PLP-dependent aminotransferase family protein [Leisingera sp. McT4-56]